MKLVFYTTIRAGKCPVNLFLLCKDSRVPITQVAEQSRRPWISSTAGLLLLLGLFLDPTILCTCRIYPSVVVTSGKTALFDGVNGDGASSRGARPKFSSSKSTLLIDS